MIIKQITDELKTIAIEHARQRMNYEYDRFHLEEDKRLSMIVIGTIGQLIFKQLLDEKHIAYQYQLQAGNYDDFDFRIRNEIYEIKCSGYDDNYRYLNLLYSKDQYNRGIEKDYSYCVQIFINGYDRQKQKLVLNNCNMANIYGYIRFNEIENYINKNKQYFADDYKVPLNRLIDIRELFNALQRKKD